MAAITRSRILGDEKIDVRSEVEDALAVAVLEVVEEIDAQNDAAAGADVPYRVTIDGRAGNLEEVRPGSLIEVTWDVGTDMVTWIHDQLVTHSPVGPPEGGHYAERHVVLADGAVTDPTDPVLAREYLFVNTSPYSGKIEFRFKAPDGVYQAVAVLAQRRYGALADISYQTINYGSMARTPSILARMR